MRHEDLWIFLEVGGHDDGRNILLHVKKIADHVAAHEEFDLAGDQQHGPVRHRAALENRHVEPVFGVRAVDERLVVTAGLRIGDPVGPEGDLIERGGRPGERHRPRQSSQDRNAHMDPSHS